MAKYIVLPTPPPPPPPPPSPPLPLHINHPFSLYAGDLHPDVTEPELYILFSIIGPLQNIHLCRDRLSRKSLCYAYINFCFPVHAADALCRLNHTEIRGKAIRIMWCQKDPIQRKTGIGNLFVKNLDSSVHETRLEEVFGVFGRILSCKIAKDCYGNSKGFGFVQFDSEESAKEALCGLNGSKLDGKILTVDKFVKKSERKEPEFTNVYVKNLDEDFSESSLKEKFSEYGKVTSAVIVHDTEGKSRGYGFVNFELHDDAKMAIEGLNGAEIGSKKWFVGKAMMKAERDVFLQRKTGSKQNRNASNLFIRNLAMSVNAENLKKVFGAFGRVTFAKVMCYKNGISKGIGYVCFSKPQEAKKAMDFLNGFCYHGKYMQVSVALSKEECEKRLQALYAFRDPFRFPYNIASTARFPFYNLNWQNPVIRFGLQKIPKLEKKFETEVQKDDIAANEANVSDDDHDGASKDESPTNSD
ncbi:polyadenylate-binding protein 6-like [Cynara cardunculus var. scolymus]|uniref:polyadenylate-binding protein 6-like n=1 Tax=Cynara cardunculus var. scolymus TaxID=59895 RepID=UPI000D6279D3|nr:polyadenylate-binding protein 6-like [Cynara cardunculus var. scolymus]